MDRITLTSKDKDGLTINGRPLGKPDKVVTTLEEALEGVVIEWNN